MFQKHIARFSHTLFSAVALAAMATASFAQITTTGIHGIVRDPSGAVVPNASLALRDLGTGIEQSTNSTADGNFAFANLQAATYRLTAKASGFQTAVIGNITVDAGRTTDVSVQLSVGSSTETVEVVAAAQQLETTSNEVGTTIATNLIQELPYNGREALSFALLMAGNANANDSSGRNSTFNGLPNASMNITVDGMNNNSQRFKSGGTSFFEFAPSRIDAVEQVTVSTTGLGADAGGQGAMTIRMTTKRGTEQYHGKVVEQFYNEDLNANSFFNNLRGLPRAKTRQNNVAGAIGGPLLPFIPSLKHKLFFFAYFEGIPLPGSQTSTANVLGSDAQTGKFNYVGTDGAPRSVNVLQIAGAAGYTSTIDPTISGILGTINGLQSNAVGYVPVAGQPFWQTMQWTQPTNTLLLYPTARLDHQITPKIAWHGTWNLRYQNIAGTPNYPGTPYNFPNAYKITTYVATNSLDWTIRPTMVNNINFGIQSNGEYFYQGADPHQYSAYGNKIINFPSNWIPTVVPGTGFQPFIRNNPVYQLTDNLNWVRGRHTITLGGTYLHTSFWETSFGSAGVLNYNLGVAATDPVATVLQNALPFINAGNSTSTSNSDLGNAQALYAFLTGRLTSVTTTTNVDENTHQYNQFAPVTQRFAFSTGAMYAQDSFRLRPDLTVNFGLRWQLDGAIRSTNGIDSSPIGANFFGPSNGPFQPGVFSGNNNPVFLKVSDPYKRDFLNAAPNVGFAWNPAGGSGLLGTLLGAHKTVIRGSASITYYNEGLNSISNVLSGGRGTTQSFSINNGAQAAPGTFPVGTLNLTSPLPAAIVFPGSFSFPLAQSAYTFSASGYSGNIVNPDLRSPYTSNWTLGIQRQFGTKTLLEVRYVGNKSTHLWHYQNVQETNIFENGFLPQFRQAQQNLAINQANGKGNTFINNGLAGQAPLPIFEAAFGPNGANNAAVASGSGFGSSSFITNLQQGVAGTMADTLATSSTYLCRMVGSNFSPCAALGYNAPGQYPLNFFRSNPFLNNMNFQNSNGDTNYNAMQVQFQHGTWKGLFVGTNFTWSHAMGDILNASDQTATYQWFTTRNARLNYGPLPFDQRKVLNAYWTYDLPFGKGKFFAVSNPVLDRVVGGWTIGGRETIRSGNPVLLSGGRNTFNNLTQAGVVFGSGLTVDQLQHDLSAITGYYAGAKGYITDIGSIATVTANTSAANPAFYAPASTPGQYSQFVFLRNNTFFQFDMSINKIVRIKERWRFNFQAEALNFANHPFFPLAQTSPTATNFGQITSATGTRTVQLRGSLEW
jgi:hypothetical protein